MTGYGKAEAMLESGKTADIGIKTSMLSGYKF